MIELKGNDEPEITDFADFAENFGNFFNFKFADPRRNVQQEVQKYDPRLIQDVAGKETSIKINLPTGNTKIVFKIPAKIVNGAKIRSKGMADYFRYINNRTLEGTCIIL